MIIGQPPEGGGKGHIMAYLTRDNAAAVLTAKTWAAIASYMDDDARETAHAELAPCTEYEFLTRYLELDPDFSGLLEHEFNIIV